VAQQIHDGRDGIIGDDPDRRGFNSGCAGRYVSECELDVFAGSKNQWRRRVREHCEVGGTHEPLHAGDEQIFDTDVVNLKRQIMRAVADYSKRKVVLRTNGDRGARWLDEGEYAAPKVAARNSPF